MNSLREPGKPVLVVDSGDLFFDRNAFKTSGDSALNKAEFLARIYKDHMGVAAVNVGQLDLLGGLDFLRRKAAGGLPLISANLEDLSSGKPLFKPFVIREVSGIRLAFFGLISADMDPIVRPKVAGKLRVQDPAEAAKRALAALAGRADIVILLSNLGLREDQRLAKSVPGIHFILGGRDGRYIRWPYRQGRTYILQSYKKGMYVGRLELELADKTSPFVDLGKPEQIKGEMQQIDRRIGLLRKANERNPTPTIERSLKKATERKAALAKELKELDTASSGGNRFRWSLKSLNSDLPQDGTIQARLKEAGIQKD